MNLKAALAAAALAALVAGANFSPAAYNPWPTGVAGTPNAAVLSIQGVSGGQPLPVTTGTGAYASATVGVSDSTILSAGIAKTLLDLVNNSSSATICVNFGATATISGTTCAAGEITLPPLWHRSWENSFIPTDAIHAIASTASTPATVGVK